MREADFEVLLRLVERLSDEQRTALGRALASASGEPEAVRLIERAFAAAPRCPHCGAERLQRWGFASGLRRYRCRACRKTFNALTGTSLARLRKKACWLRYGEALAAGMTPGARRPPIAACTSRPASAGGTASCARPRRRARPWAAWSRRTRPSFAAPTKVPADGAAATPRPAEGRAGAASGRASAGLSAEQVPALIARDRAGHTADAVLPDLGADAIAAALGPVVAGDAVLCSDGAKAYAAFAAGAAPPRADQCRGRGSGRDGAFHVQNVNAYHGRLKGWMGRFNGVATRYLPNYLGWRRTLERAPEPSASRTWLLAAARSTATANAN